MRLFVLAAVAAIVVALVASPGLAGTAARQAPNEGVAVLEAWPRAGEVVDTGQTEVSALVVGDQAAALWLDGGEVVRESTAPLGGGEERVLTASVELAAGDHIGQVMVDGQMVHAWRFTVSDHSVLRHDATSATALAADLARAHQDGSAAGAVLVRADDAADALSGAALAAALGVPLLLTDTAALPDTTRAALTDLAAPSGVVHLLGGEAAIGPAVADAVAALGFTVRRHAGADRYDTAASAAGVLPPGPIAYLASGTSYADALAAAPAATGADAPILLSAADRLPDTTAAALANRGVTDVVVVGGTAVIEESVVDDLRGLGIDVRRVAGPDRAATAAAMAAEPSGTGDGGVAIASSADPLVTLVASRDAAAAGRPLLLSDNGRLGSSALAALASVEPGSVVVYGPAEAVPDAVGRDARAALTSGAEALRDRFPSAGAVVPAGRIDVTAVAAGVVDAARSVVTAVVDGRTVPVTVTAVEDRLLATVDVTGAATRDDGPVVLRLVALVALADPAAGWARADWTVTIEGPDTVFATTGGVEVHLPSSDVALIGYHQSNHDGAQGLASTGNDTPAVVMQDRGRDTHPTGAADIVANPALPITAPVTGTVVRAGSYTLYCDYTDHYLVIEPDQRPGWEVKLLHFTDLSVAVGDRVVGGATQVGSGPRRLPFRSQIDAYDQARGWPHVHIEVVDPSIPDRPGSGC